MHFKKSSFFFLLISVISFKTVVYNYFVAIFQALIHVPIQVFGIFIVISTVGPVLQLLQQFWEAIADLFYKNNIKRYPNIDRYRCTLSTIGMRNRIFLRFT